MLDGQRLCDVDVGPEGNESVMDRWSSMLDGTPVVSGSLGKPVSVSATLDIEVGIGPMYIVPEMYSDVETSTLGTSADELMSLGDGSDITIAIAEARVMAVTAFGTAESMPATDAA